MIEENMLWEDRMGKILSFIGGCIAGVAGVFAVAVVSQMSPCTTPYADSRNGEQNEILAPPEGSSNLGN